MYEVPGKEPRHQIILAKSCDDFYNELPHTFILLDDTINILMERKYRKLSRWSSETDSQDLPYAYACRT
jgi:hypothetical protein